MSKLCTSEMICYVVKYHVMTLRQRAAWHEMRNNETNSEVYHIRRWLKCVESYENMANAFMGREKQFLEKVCL